DRSEHAVPEESDADAERQIENGEHGKQRAEPAPPAWRGKGRIRRRRGGGGREAGQGALDETLAAAERLLAATVGRQVLAEPAVTLEATHEIAEEGKKGRHEAAGEREALGRDHASREMPDVLGHAREVRLVDAAAAGEQRDRLAVKEAPRRRRGHEGLH